MATQQRMMEGPRPGREVQLARALGWFSVGLGLAHVAAPRGLARTIGIRERDGLLRAVGLREIASGVGILASRQPAGWLGTRVWGDAMDLAVLGAALRSDARKPGRVATAAAVVVGLTALDVLCRRELARRTGAASESGAVWVEGSIAINRSPEECYQFWRSFENLPRFMKHVESVDVLGDTRSHWQVEGPAGATLEWDAEIVHDESGRSIAWRSLDGADVDHRGSVRFERAPGGRGTIVRLELQYHAPAGVVGDLVATLFGKHPKQQVRDNLHRFKQVMETGEVATTEGQSSGRRSAKIQLLKKWGR